MPNMDYALIQRTPDGTGQILVTIPGIPDKGSYVLEADLKIYTNQGMVAIADIVDDLVTADATKPLSANQGVVLKQLIDAVSGGITPKGDILSTNLPAADDSNKGWQYYCTDLNKYATSDGTQWVYTSNSIIVQTPDATDTGHALSNAVVTQKCNAVEATLNQHDARLQNLEQKAGDYVPVQYRGTNAVPTGKASYGLVEKIVGKTRAWDQLLDNNRITSLSVGVNYLGLVNYISGHKYLAVQKGTTVGYMQTDSELPIANAYSLPSGELTGGIGTAQSSFISGAFFNNTGSQTQTGDFFFCIYDLTLIFGAGNEPSTVADALAQLPVLGQYNAYDAGSLVDTEVSGVKSVGRNLFNGVWEDGYLDSSNGNILPSTFYKTTDYIPIKPLTEFYIMGTLTSVDSVNVAYYGQNKEFIYFEGSVLSGLNRTFTTQSGVYYMRVTITIASTKTEGFMINQSDSLNGTYSPYKTDTLSLSEPVTLRSAGSVADELMPEEGKKQELIDVVDLSPSQTTWYYNSSIQRFYAVVPNGRILSSQYTNTNAICSKYPISPSVYATMADKTFVFSDRTFNVESSYIIIRDDSFISQSSPIDAFKSAMSGVYLAYEKSTPTTDTISPVPDNTIYTEGGGTINTIQTQTPVIDNCLDVGYLAV